MKFTVEHTLGSSDTLGQLCTGTEIAEFAFAAEAAGFDAIAFTEHPAPSAKWLHTGGHLTYEPLAALAFCAAATTTLRLLTYLLVLPYHNPLAVAKAAATVDRLSGGRLTLGVGVGYLRSEFAALGRAYEQRGRLFDEALHVLRQVWTEESFSKQGIDFNARSVVSQPGPVQLPHPPIWIGGSGRMARRRVVAHGEGWMPLMLGEQLASTTGTQALTSPAEVASAVGELKAAMTEAGRDPDELRIQLHGPQSDIDADYSVEQRRDHLGELAVAGVTDFFVRPPVGPAARSIDALRGYARDVAGL